MPSLEGYSPTPTEVGYSYDILKDPHGRGPSNEQNPPPASGKVETPLTQKPMIGYSTSKTEAQTQIPAPVRLDDYRNNGAVETDLAVEEFPKLKQEMQKMQAQMTELISQFKLLQKEIRLLRTQPESVPVAVGPEVIPQTLPDQDMQDQEMFAGPGSGNPARPAVPVAELMPPDAGGWPDMDRPIRADDTWNKLAAPPPVETMGIPGVESEMGTRKANPVSQPETAKAAPPPQAAPEMVSGSVDPAEKSLVGPEAVSGSTTGPTPEASAPPLAEAGPRNERQTAEKLAEARQQTDVYIKSIDRMWKSLPSPQKSSLKYSLLRDKYSLTVGEYVRTMQEQMSRGFSRKFAGLEGRDDRTMLQRQEMINQELQRFDSELKRDYLEIFQHIPMTDRLADPHLKRLQQHGGSLDALSKQLLIDWTTNLEYQSQVKTARDLSLRVGQLSPAELAQSKAWAAKEAAVRTQANMEAIMARLGRRF